MKEKVDKLDIIKMKNLFFNNHKEVKRPPENGRKDKKPVFRMYDN
jgi:hypothetical protein